VFFDAGVSDAIAVRLAAVPIRVGWRGGIASLFFNQSPPARRPENEIDAHLQLAHSIGANINHPEL
jgi:hypothetical protein